MGYSLAAVIGLKERSPLGPLRARFRDLVRSSLLLEADIDGRLAGHPRLTRDEPQQSRFPGAFASGACGIDIGDRLGVPKDAT